MKIQAFTLIVALLSACSSPMLQNQEHGEYIPIAQSAWIEIKQKIFVEADNARAYFQAGELISPSSLDLYQVDCEIEVRDVLATRQWVNPGKFKIIRAQQDQSPIVLLPGQKHDYAWLYDRAPSDTKRFWKFTLRSRQQPNVMHLICRGVQDAPYNAKLPTSTEMQTALGPYIALHLF